MHVVPSTKQNTPIEMSGLAKSIFEQKYSWRDDEGNPTEAWADTAFRVTKHVLGALGIQPGDKQFQTVLKFIEQRKFLPAGRFIANAGRPFHMTNNCFMCRAEDSREGWSELLYKAAMTLQTGGGFGVDYSDIRPNGALIKKTGGIASGPMALMHMINETGRYIQSGGHRRAAIIALLNWSHPDIKDFIHLKDWSADLVALKEKDLMHPLPMELTNISVSLDDEFFAAYDDPNHTMHLTAREVYSEAVSNMVLTGEPGFSIDVGQNAGETLRNPCSEICSADDSDVCCLGSINLANVEDLAEMAEVVDAGTLFLLAGTVYSDVPYAKVAEVREKNRRLGLGLMGIHEWLIKRGKSYDPDDELGQWLTFWQQGSEESASYYARRYDLSIPVKVRAVAPTGSISIIAETTSGIEPLFCVAYKRRYLNGSWRYQYVIDPTAKRLSDQIDPASIEDAYMLSYNVERRIAMQAWIQQYCDHAVSSTVNAPYPVTDPKEAKSIGDMLYSYLPQLRGVTWYPDGARGGQPLTAVPFEEAQGNEGIVYEEISASCKSGVCSM